MNSSLNVFENIKSLKVLKVCVLQVLTYTMGKELDYATCAHNAVENEAHLVLECPLYNPIQDMFHHYLRT